MEEETLIFDDWAMYLAERWWEIAEEFEAKKLLHNEGDKAVDTEVVRLLMEHGKHLQALLYYLVSSSEFDVPRYRRGYQSYITLDAETYQAVQVLTSRMLAHGRKSLSILLLNHEERQKIEQCLRANYHP